MNYPFRTSLLAYLQGGGAEAFRDAMETLRENYPPAAFYSALNFLGTHDTPRILTVLGGGPLPEGREAQSAFRLSPAARQRGLRLVSLAAAILFTFPGSPMIYYGDEAGLEGCGDPFNRGTYPWGREHQGLVNWFTRLGAFRQQRPSLQRGGIRWLAADGPLLAFSREYDGEITITALNAGDTPRTLTLPKVADLVDLIRSQEIPAGEEGLTLTLPGHTARLLGN